MLPACFSARLSARLSGYLQWPALVRSRRAQSLAGVALAATLGIGWADHIVEARAAPYVSSSSGSLPELKVGLLLGCSKQLADGRPNLFFVKRIAAAAQLFKAGKVQYLLVSGDNSRQSYDEPTDMRRALLAAGVPSARIVLDYAGFRTLDSVLRAKDVFGLRRFIVISQRFHDLRAVYLARAHGVEAYGYAAADVGGADGLRVRLREVFSRTFALLDVSVLKSRPHFDGPAERLLVGASANEVDEARASP